MALLIQGITALGTWSEHNILPASETEWIAEDWPWYVDCPPYFPSEVNLIRDSSTLGSGAFQYKIGMDFTGDEPLAAFPTDQTIKVRWLEVERDATLAIVGTPVAKEEEFTLSASDTEFISPSYYTTAAPADPANTMGVEGPYANPTITAEIVMEAARERKAGFFAYTLPTDPPAVYAKETQTGSKGACGDAPSEAYDGYYEYVDEDAAFDTRTADTLTREYFSLIRGTGYPSIPATSRTVCQRDLSFYCPQDAETKEGSITIELTDEILTSEIQATVATENAGGGTYGDDANSLAYDYLAPDETILAVGTSEWHLEGNGNLNDFDGTDFDVEADVTTYQLPSGNATTETITETITGGVGSAVGITRNTSADPQTWQIVHNMRVVSAATTPAQFLSVEAVTDATRIDH